MKRLLLTLLLVAGLSSVAAAQGSVWLQNTSSVPETGMMRDALIYENTTDVSRNYGNYSRLMTRKTYYQSVAKWVGLSDTILALAGASPTVSSAFGYFRHYNAGSYTASQTGMKILLKDYREGTGNGGAGPGVNAWCTDYDSGDPSSNRWMNSLRDEDAQSCDTSSYNGPRDGGSGGDYCDDTVYWYGGEICGYESVGSGGCTSGIDSTTVGLGDYNDTSPYTPVIDYYINPPDPPNGSGYYMRVDMTDWVQAIVDSTIPNYGLLFYQTGTLRTGRMIVYSSNNAASYAPALYVEWAGGPAPEPDGNIKGVSISGASLQSTEPD